MYPTDSGMTNNNNLTKAQLRTQARRAKRAREAAAREAAVLAEKLRREGKGVKAPVTKVPQAPKFKGGLSAAERRALSRVQGLTQREVAEIRETNNQATVERLKVRAQREAAEKRKRMRRRQQNYRIVR
jgi:FtsZ-binding cell division protein ZapB